MDSDRWKQVSRIYGAALAKQGPERGPYPRSGMRDDPDLRLEVEALLAESRERYTPLDLPLRRSPPTCSATTWSVASSDLINWIP